MPTPGDSAARLFRKEYVIDDDGASGDDRPVSRLAALVIAEGFRSRARAVRLIGEVETGSVEYDIDGEWRRMMKLPGPAFLPLVNRLKIMAVLDISRRPSQSGEIHVRFGGALRVLSIQTESSPAGQETVLLTLPSATSNQ